MFLIILIIRIIILLIIIILIIKIIVIIIIIIIPQQFWLKPFWLKTATARGLSKAFIHSSTSTMWMLILGRIIIFVMMHFTKRPCSPKDFKRVYYEVMATSRKDDSKSKPKIPTKAKAEDSYGGQGGGTELGQYELRHGPLAHDYYRIPPMRSMDPGPLAHYWTPPIGGTGPPQPLLGVAAWGYCRGGMGEVGGNKYYACPQAPICHQGCPLFVPSLDHLVGRPRSCGHTLGRTIVPLIRR